MFWSDLVTLTNQLSRFGLHRPLLHIGGSDEPSIIDFPETSQDKTRRSTEVYLTQRPFDHIDQDYRSLPFDSCITGGTTPGTLVCLNWLEQMKNPFDFAEIFAPFLADDGLLFITSTFTSNARWSPEGNWRISPSGLCELASAWGWIVLDSGWSINLTTEDHVVDEQGKPIILQNAFATLARQHRRHHQPVSFSLPSLHAERAVQSPETMTATAPPEKPIRDYQPRKLISDKPTCVFLNTMYNRFLDYHYTSHPELLRASYDEQLSALQSTMFGDSDFYSQGLHDSGWGKF